MKPRIIAILLIIAPMFVCAEDADQINRIKWEESKDHPTTWHGKIGDDWVVSASSRNKDGISEIQMITLPGIKSRITVFTDRNKETKKFNHSVSIPKDFPYQVKIEPRKKNGGIAITVTLNNNSSWIIFTDPELNLIGLNHFP
ncbi:hypothetical protein JIN85_05960 [Luteolibacter pohnpeiensis]|uniref:Uncharacterized protein n=1 Tax=Luteolibacter pohnpeiensis TaxID=454153 RepID=A0A934S2F3_9BACT|nr:hypothetical protein [Luteolibacter pohnpeiensis]MBK1881950.1 hypothetical protein [Luteolibacter pohnpeiensis]